MTQVLMFVAGFGVGLCAAFFLQALIDARRTRASGITRAHVSKAAAWRRRNPDIVTTRSEATEPTELDQ